ncbi:MAG: S-methyl-5-thioribose-1-phosphate isomerase [Gammaproteobacteria bacterium]|nr:S-methyl-5-thioribose-1-phosphate isomerase [Gammaproteobacteria bacterium]
MNNPSEELSSLRWNSTRGLVEIIDQTALPHDVRWVALDSLDAYCHAINAMQVRGAPLIGVTAAFGLAQALAEDASDFALRSAYAALLATRPTAVNLRWALDQVSDAVRDLAGSERVALAHSKALALREADIKSCASIGDHGLGLLRDRGKGDVINVLTHCNAGWLATVQWGTALAPVYKAHAQGLPVHVWVSETRPRNQGMFLTAWELQRAGVPCTLVADNSCGQLISDGKVDCVIVGSDRTAANGDVCNKVGTYLKALAAQAHDVPFYVALPASTIDWKCASGADIPIEQRDTNELLHAEGLDNQGVARSVRMAGPAVVAHNPAFDVTPAQLVTALITDQGTFEASTAGLADLQQRMSKEAGAAPASQAGVA